jgi:DNA-binding transcriptional MerR regulator
MTALSSSDVCERADLDYRSLDHWCRKGAIVPSVADTIGSGNFRVWSTRDAAVIAAITRVRHDFAALGGTITTALVRRLWDDLHRHPTATIRQGTVTITVGLGLEDG